MNVRSLTTTLKKKCAENKIVVLRGAKRTGRLQIVQQLFDVNVPSVISIDFEDKKVFKTLNQLSTLIDKTNGKKVILLREAQLFSPLQEYIDWVLDQETIDNLILICSNEPSLHEDLWDALREQDLEIRLFPLSYEECAHAFGLVQEDKLLENRLIYGYYPDVVENPHLAESLLYEIVDSTTIHTLSAFERINKVEKLVKLLRHLAFNIGKVLSFNDLGKKCGLDNETVERYVRLFEKAQILIVIPSFYKGHRYELKKSYVVYFIDNGIRNALIRAFQPLEFRNDLSELWKNWVVSERYKANQYANRIKSYYFWLTHTKQEIDLIEVDEKSTQGFKMQFNSEKTKVPKLFTDLYPEIKISLINRKSFMNFLRKQ